MKKQIVVIYHKGCPDGITGAWVADTVLGDDADYLPGTHQAEPPAELAHQTLYFIDFSYPPEMMKRLKEENEKIVILDHHQTTEASMTYAAPESVFDTRHSGAVIAWQYFRPNEPVPRFLRYIEDIDLWKFSLPHAEEISAFLDTQQPLSFPAVASLVAQCDDGEGFDYVREKGSAALAYKSAVIRDIVGSANPVSFEGYRVLAVNAPVLESEVGNALYVRQPPFSIVWCERAEGTKVSLRSDGSVDVAAIAQKYGGGGHRGAAAFKLPLYKELPWKYLNE